MSFPNSLLRARGPSREVAVHPLRGAPRWLGLLALLVLLPATRSSAYVRSRTEDGAGLKWVRSCVTFEISASGAPWLSFDESMEVVRRSFATWDAVPCSELRLRFGGKSPTDSVGYSTRGNNSNVVVWRSRADWAHPSDVVGLTTITYCPFVQAGCPFTGAVLDADIEINNAFFPARSRSPNAPIFDLENTMTHEVGHFVGLDHTPVAQATMFASASPGETSKRALHADDVEGVCAIYPPRTDAGVECPPIELDQELYAPGRERAASSGGDDGCRQIPGRGHRGGGALAILGLLGLAATRRRRIRPPPANRSRNGR